MVSVVTDSWFFAFSCCPSDPDSVRPSPSAELPSECHVILSVRLISSIVSLVI